MLGNCKKDRRLGNYEARKPGSQESAIAFWLFQLDSLPASQLLAFQLSGILKFRTSMADRVATLN
jgi:hypothetical protein